MNRGLAESVHATTHWLRSHSRCSGFKSGVTNHQIILLILGTLFRDCDDTFLQLNFSLLITHPYVVPNLMSLLLFSALNVGVALLSMQGQKALGFHIKKS